MPGPNRPLTINSQNLLLNGCPVFLGQIVSSAGAAVNNLTTAAPFNATPLQPTASSTGGVNMTGSLAGKVLLVQSTAAGFLLPSTSGAVTVTNQSGALPGVSIQSGVTQILVMRQDMGWLQWLPVAGVGNLLVWELT